MKQKENSEKYIGLVKWFHDSVKKANYGFIQHAVLGDLFFHENSIEQGQDNDLFRENELVVFVSQPSHKHKEKIEAVQVKILKTETDIRFLFGHFLFLLTEKGKYTDYNIIQRGVHSRILELIEVSENTLIRTELLRQYKEYLRSQIENTYQLDIIFIKGLFNVGRNYFPDSYVEITELLEPKIPTEVAHSLWMENYLDKCQVDHIAETILKADTTTKRTIFARCSDEDKSNILFKIIFDFEQIDVELEIVKEFLKLSKEFALEQHDKVLNAVLNICSVHFKLSLWLEDYHGILDFDAYKYYTITLSPNDQKKFVKKTLKYIHEDRVQISLKDFTSINTIDYDTSKLAHKIDYSTLDYSTSVILNVIRELDEQTNIETRKETYAAQRRLYDLIIKQINKPDDILEIKGYFDECEGRCSVSIAEEKNDSGEVIDKHIEYHRDEYNKPKLHPICDGRKAINKSTNKPSIAESNHLEFWWCGNQLCYKPSRQLHTSDEWEKYSLLDFLTILKTQFREKDLEMYLSLINKANRFLKHLKCRSCDHILRPIRQSNYAFYGVNDFHCINEGCVKKGERVYLTHCLNGQCEQAIDSRDSVRCRPDSVDPEKCGWYVCNYCHSCCSSEVIDRRISILKRTGQEYTCHIIGHRDLGIISCNKCGHAMNSNEYDTAEYQKVLQWFIDNKDDQDYIVKSGQTKHGKWWFRFKNKNLPHHIYYQKLGNLIKLGFSVPNFEERNRPIQLVAESSKTTKIDSDVLVCSNLDCGNILNLTSDLERASAIKRFHDVCFKRQTVVK